MNSNQVRKSFIDYFKNNSEIYKGMKLIDQKLGGTTLLDITIDLLDKLDKGADGYQWIGGDNKEHFIEINENQYYDDFVTAVMHEMVHVKQDYRKDKRPIEDKEKEAYEQQEILFERWKNDN